MGKGKPALHKGLVRGSCASPAGGFAGEETDAQSGPAYKLTAIHVPAVLIVYLMATFLINVFTRVNRQTVIYSVLTCSAADANSTATEGPKRLFSGDTLCRMDHPEKRGCART